MIVYRKFRTISREFILKEENGCIMRKMRVTIDFKTYTPIEDIIRRFGKESLVSGVESKLYKFEITESRESLRLKGFNGAGILGAMKAIRSGRPIEFICKSSGRVKKEFHGVTFRKLVYSMSTEQTFENMYTIAFARDKFMEAYKKFLDKKFKDIEMLIDPITCDKIKVPVYLKTDWDMGCKIVYDFDTVSRCARFSEIPLLIVVDPETGEETEICDKKFEGFFSPYTNTKFYGKDVKTVPLVYLRNHPELLFI